MSNLDEFWSEALRACYGYRARGYGHAAEEAKRRAAQMGLTLPTDPRTSAATARNKQQAALKEVFPPGELSRAPSRSLVQLAEGTAALCLFGDLKVSQIRNFFGHVKRLSSQFRTRGFSHEEVELLRIPLVYSRARNEAIEPLYNTCAYALDGISAASDQGLRDFAKFEKLLEAVVAFHKFHGGE